MGLADKFGNFNVKQTDRISQEDKEYLEHYEALYKRALNVYKCVYDIYRNEFATYLKEDIEGNRYSNVIVGDFDTIKKIDELQNGYVSHIFYYFSNKYNVTLDSDVFPRSDIDGKYRSCSYEKQPEELVVDMIDWHVVVDKIIDQLGGMGFQDKAIKEVKDKLKEKCYNSYHNDWNIKLKGKRFTYTAGYCSQSWGNEWNFGSIEFMRALLDALSINMFGEKRTLHQLSRLYESYHIRLYEDDFKDGFSCPSVGVELIKFFKNGRVDIVFQSGDFARNFAREWCGYTLV